MPQPMPINGFVSRDLMMMEQAMPMAAPGVSSNMNNIFDNSIGITDIDSVSVNGDEYAGQRNTGLGVGLMSLAGGSSFMVGTAVIGAIAFVIYLIQQLRKKKEK